MKKDWDELVEIADDEVNRVITELPPDIKERAGKAKVSFESRSEEGDGEEDKAVLGHFLADPVEETEGQYTPEGSEIILYVQTIWKYAGQQEEKFRAEVRDTFLHELSHYLGMPEGEIGRKNLKGQ
jgi:predicted Zn-dependent protease with MMP-like domain